MTCLEAKRVGGNFVHSNRLVLSGIAPLILPMFRMRLGIVN